MKLLKSLLCATFIFSFISDAFCVCDNSTKCCQKTTKQFCCPNGTTETTYSCPTFWTYISSSNICSRSSISSSDSTGYYTQNYGTCEPTATTAQCYSGADSSGNLRCVRCYL